jgi:1,4-dihydroxy-2-naphthoyl-CoA synthase
MSESLIVASTPLEGVRVLALNRPSKRNALSQELITVFLEQLKTASRDDGVRVIVITGSSTFFCGTKEKQKPTMVPLFQGPPALANSSGRAKLTAQTSGS